MMPVLSEPRVEAEPLRDGLVQAAEEAGHDSAGVVAPEELLYSQKLGYDQVGALWGSKTGHT
jgi:hypothetical protein